MAAEDDGEIDRTECTIMQCSGTAEYGYWVPDLGDFSRARQPEHDLLDDGDLSPYVCERCRDRMAAQSRWDADRFSRPKEKLIADGGEVESPPVKIFGGTGDWYECLNCPGCGTPLAKDDFAEHIRSCEG